MAELIIKALEANIVDLRDFVKELKRDRERLSKYNELLDARVQELTKSYSQMQLTEQQLQVARGETQQSTEEVRSLRIQVAELERQIFVLLHTKRDDATIGQGIRLHCSTVTDFGAPLFYNPGLTDQQALLLRQWGVIDEDLSNFSVWRRLIKAGFQFLGNSTQKLRKAKEFQDWVDNEGRLNEVIPEKFLQVGLHFMVFCCLKLDPALRDRCCVDSSESGLHGSRAKVDESILEGSIPVKQEYRNFMTGFELKVSAASGRKQHILVGQTTERVINTFQQQPERMFQIFGIISQTTVQLLRFRSNRHEFDNVTATPVVPLFPSSINSSEFSGLKLIIWLSRLHHRPLGYSPKLQ